MEDRRYGIENVYGDDFGQMCSEIVGRVVDAMGAVEVVAGTAKAAGTANPATERDAFRVVKLVFFGNPVDNAAYERELDAINACVSKRFGDERPVVTYVAQRPLGASLAVEVTSVAVPKGKIKYGDNTIVFADRTGSELVVGGVRADSSQVDTETQSEQIFARIGHILSLEGFPVQSIARQWNYIEDITGFDGDRQHYQDFNDARSRFYTTASWQAGYPAATGIGTQKGGVIVGFNARKDAEGVINIPLDNALQRAAHCYSQQVLVGGQKSTPKFERARLIGYPDDATVFVSGTAAIRGEGSLSDCDVAAQVRITMENIEHLCSPENINSHGTVVTEGRREFALLRVYIKNPGHLAQVKEYLETHYVDVPKLYLEADVCRPELLVEIEGIATIK